VTITQYCKKHFSVPKIHSKNTDISEIAKYQKQTLKMTFLHISCQHKLGYILPNYNLPLGMSSYLSDEQFYVINARDSLSPDYRIEQYTNNNGKKSFFNCNNSHLTWKY